MEFLINTFECVWIKLHLLHLLSAHGAFFQENTSRFTHWDLDTLL